MIRDMMPPFELFQPRTVQEAVALLARYGKEGWALAGGLDSLDWFKDRVKRPKAVVDLGGIEEMRGIRSGPDGLEIGALTTLTEVENHPEIRSKYSVLAQAASQVASPQIRNQGTLGGNVAQDCRCWYYRGGFNCYRAGGNTCYADTPTAMNQEHCLFGANRCITVNCSDCAPALIALDARMVIASPKGIREVPAEEFFIGPDIDITRMTILQPGDVLTTIKIPSTWAGTRMYFEKVRHRQSWDFPIVNVAAAAVLKGGVIDRIRLVVNGVAARPMRLTQVEEEVKGNPPNEKTAELAGELAIWGARPVNYNGHKVILMKNLVKRAIRGLAS